MNLCKANDIASIKTGYPFRTRLKTTESGGFSVIQMRNLRNGTVDCSDLAKTDIHNASENNLARRGDIILRSRGSGTHSAIIREDPGKAVVASPLLVIRVKNRDEVLPEYLHWYLNEREAQNHMARHATGTIINIINKRALTELTVPLPSLAVQQNIADIAALAAQEQTLLATLAKKRRQIISLQLMHHAKKDLS